jgi:hypothetical protein
MLAHCGVCHPPQHIVLLGSGFVPDDVGGQNVLFILRVAHDAGNDSELGEAAAKKVELKICMDHFLHHIALSSNNLRHRIQLLRVEQRPLGFR